MTLVDPLRRTMLRATVAGSMLPLAVACSGLGPVGGEGPDLTTAAGRLRTYLRMRGSLDDRVVIGSVTGRYFGVVDTEPVPLFGVSAATVSRYRPLPDGRVLLFSCEQAYYTDLDTGLVLDDWLNPYTGERVKVPVVRSEAAKLTIDDRLVFTGPAIPGVSAEHIVLAPERQAGDLVFVEQVRFAATAPGQTKPFRYSEAVSARSRLADFASDSPRVPCTTAFTNMSSWRPWMRMGERPGVLVAHGTGRYGAAIDELPKVWLDATRKNRPELLDDPGRPLEAAWKS